MDMVLSSARLIGLVLGSAIAGGAFCFALWQAFAAIRHPKLGLFVVPLMIGLALVGLFPDDEFLRRALTFSGIVAIPLLITELAWRADLPSRAQHRGTDEPRPQTGGRLRSSPVPFRRKYPVITGCICEGRRPDPSEVKHVAARTLREAFATHSSPPVFEDRRAALRVARAALEGADIRSA